MRENLRRYLPSFAELVDRLSILQLKEVFIEHNKEEYAKEIEDVKHDIQLMLGDRDVNADDIRTIIVLAQMNAHIWYNEKSVRDGTGDGDLMLTHSINGIRNIAKNRLNRHKGERQDYKIDCLAEGYGKWKISW